MDGLRGAGMPAIWKIVGRTLLTAGVVIANLVPLRVEAQTSQTAAAPVAPSELSGEVVPIVSSRTPLEVAERFSKVVKFDRKVLRVDGFDPAVLGVTALSPNLLRIQAADQGVTTIVVTDEDNKVYTLEVFVTGDARLLQSVLRRAFPDTAVTATKVRDSVMLRGWATEPQQISQIVELAELYFPRVLNQMKLGGPQEVQLRVKIMEVQRSKIRRLGVNFAIMGRNAGFVSQPGNIGTLTSFNIPGGGGPGQSFNQLGLANPSMLLGVATDDIVFEGLLQALKEEGLLKIQAEPVLVTRSGEPARLINGGEFPIPVPQSLGTVTIEWREFGVVLESLPVVISPTRLKQTITAEVSERDFTTAVTLNGTTVPGLTKRKVETQTEMNFGETLVIGGLVTTRRTSETDKIPFLGELPVIGAAFRNVNYNETETELLVMITPEYVQAMPSDQMPPGGPGAFTDTPTDRELYWQGIMEVPNYGDRCEGCASNGTTGYPGAGMAPQGTMIQPGPAGSPYTNGPGLDGTPTPLPPQPGGEMMPPAPVEIPSDLPMIPPQTAKPPANSSRWNFAGRNKTPAPRPASAPRNSSGIIPAGAQSSQGGSGLIEPAGGSMR